MNKKILDKIFLVVAVCVVGVFVSSNFLFANKAENIQVIKSTDESKEEIKIVNNESINSLDGEILGSVENGVQIIEFDLKNDSYPHLNVSAEIPVKLIINVDEESLNGCNYVVISSDFGIEQQLDIGENIIEFMPNESGQYVYSCWMGMVGAYINVYDEDITPSATYGENITQGGGCCSF